MRYFNYNIPLEGELDGVNKIFLLTETPDPAASLMVMLNGQIQTVSEDYTLASDRITFVVAPRENSILRAFFRQNY